MLESLCFGPSFLSLPRAPHSFLFSITKQPRQPILSFLFCSPPLFSSPPASSPLVFVLRSYLQLGSPTLLCAWAFFSLCCSPRFIFSSCPVFSSLLSYYSSGALPLILIYLHCFSFFCLRQARSICVTAGSNPI